ncbi:O-antigen ligase family protein [Microbacterium sp. NPDC055910]|uniref:O-antigen ligase family protein n=1 Tax=Microbacterium sp. NPDC055910 TaxID=3345659 RepID=UPI0035DFA4E0
MTVGPSEQRRWLGALLSSPSFARAYTLTALAAVFSSFAIERLMSPVTYVTIVAGLCVVGAGVLFARRREISFVRLVPTTLVVFLGWALASVFWSFDRPESWWGWVSLAAIAFLAIVVGHIRDTLQTARAVGDVLRVLLSISLGVEILSGILLDIPFRFLGVEGQIAALGPVQGIFGTRNMLGFVAVVALITFLVEYRTQSVRPGVSLFSVVLAGMLAAFSDSPTVLVLAVGVGLAVGALALVRHARPAQRSALQWVLGGLVVVGVIVGYLARHPIIAWLGAGSDFSTRVDLWNVMVDYLRTRPVQGWGWYGLWPQDGVPFGSINFLLNDTHATGLNAYFDVLLQLGWVGLVLFLGFAGVALVRSWLDASERRSIIYAWTPLILVALFIDSFFESFTLIGIGWMLLVLCAVRAGQSRSWRERMGSSAAPGLPRIQDPPNAAG